MEQQNKKGKLGLWIVLYVMFSVGLFFLRNQIPLWVKNNSKLEALFFRMVDTPVYYAPLGPPAHCTYSPFYSHIPYLFGTGVLLLLYKFVLRNEKIPKRISIAILISFWSLWGVLGGYIAHVLARS